MCRKRPFAIHRGVRARPGGLVSGVAVVAPGASQPGRAQKKGRASTGWPGVRPRRTRARVVSVAAVLVGAGVWAAARSKD